MNTQWFQIINLLLILIVLILLLIYFWDNFIGTAKAPIEWQEARKSQRIGKGLLKFARFYPDKVRFYNWWIQVERLKKDNIPGAFAELGVYQGDSAVILNQMDLERQFHLFDTFLGFPDSDLSGETGEAATYTVRNFADTNLEKVKKRFGAKQNLHFHKGYFPDTTIGLENETFSLVNLDADLYKPTMAALLFFYPRLSPKGVIFIHDYSHKWEGIIKAVNEFAELITEVPILIPDKEGTIMIIKSKKN